MKGLKVLVAAACAFSLVACGANDSGESATSGDVTTITHKLGETKVEGVPKRIVTIGNQWLDAAQALGVTPVGYVDNVAVMGGGKPVPWEPESLKDANKIQPGGNIVEQVAALNPDLILAASFAVDKPTYEKLNNQVAPTIVDLTQAQIDPWADQVRALGKVLHKQSEADKVIADVDAKIAAVGAKYPGLKGKTFLTCYLAGPSQLMIMADDKDGSAEMFVKLGMTVPPKLAAETGKGGRLALSPERLADLDADLLVCSAAPGQENAYKALPGYDNLPSVRKGSIAILDVLRISGLNQPTALSVPFLLGELEPFLANAAK